MRALDIDAEVRPPLRQGFERHEAFQSRVTDTGAPRGDEKALKLPHPCRPDQSEVHFAVTS